MNADQTRLPIDLTDPKDVRDKLPDARHVLREKQKAAAVAQAEAQRWERLVEYLAEIAAPTEAESNGGSSLHAAVKKRRRQAAPRQEAAVKVVREKGGPMKAAEVAEAMGEPDKVNSINAALWAAARAGRGIEKVGTLYVPLDESEEAAM